MKLPGKMEYSNYLLFLFSPLAHNKIFQNVGAVSEPPPPPWEDRGGAFQGFGRAGVWSPVTRPSSPLLLLPARVTSQPGPQRRHLGDEDSEEATLRFPPALTFFTQAGP